MPLIGLQCSDRLGTKPERLNVPPRTEVGSDIIPLRHSRVEAGFIGKRGGEGRVGLLEYSKWG